MKPVIRLSLNLIPAIILLTLCFTQIHTVTWWNLLIIPIVYLLGTFLEWFVHKYILHRKFILTQGLYYWHMVHHRNFAKEMGIKSWQQIENVLIPLSGVAYLFLLIIPVLMLAAGLVGAAWFTGICLVGFYLFYETSHLIQHLPSQRTIHQAYRNHHQLHHQKYPKGNFGVTSELSDLMLGTRYSEFNRELFF